MIYTNSGQTVSYAGESTFLRMLNGIFHYPQELQITSTLKRLIDDPAVIGFSTGHGERSYSRNSDSDYNNVLNQKHKSPISIDNLGYELVELLLGDHESLKSIDILVIASPKTDFNSMELRNLSEFIEEGGNAFITIEPNHLGSLQDLLGKIGVYQMPGMLSQDHKGQYDKNFILAEYIPESTFFPNTFVDQSVLDFKFKLTMPSASALEFKEENYSDTFCQNSILFGSLSYSKPCQIYLIYGYSSSFFLMLDCSLITFLSAAS